MGSIDKQRVVQAARKIVELEAQALQEAAALMGDETYNAVELILNSRGRLVVSGMGKSGLVGRKIAATLSSTGTPSMFIHPGEALHGDLGMIIEQDVVLLLSNSGETEEIIRLVPFIRRIGAKIICMVAEKNSTLSKMSDVTLCTGVKREACPINLAPTSSTTVTMALGDALAGALIDARGFEEKDFARLHPSGSLGRRFLTVRDLMHTGDRIPFAKPDIKLRDAIIQMSSGGFGALIVEENNEMAGIFTDGDLRRYFERTDGDLSTTLRSVMVRNPRSTTPERLVMEALKIMEDKSITSLPVLENNRVVGFLHLHDILRSRLV